MGYKRLTCKNAIKENCVLLSEEFCMNAKDLMSHTKQEIMQKAIDRLAKLEDKIENGTLVELPIGWLETLKLLTSASMCYSDIMRLIENRLSKSEDIAELFFRCPRVQGTLNDFSLEDLAKSNLKCDDIKDFDEILSAMPRFREYIIKRAEVKLKELKEKK